MEEKKITTKLMDKTTEELHKDFDDDFVKIIDANEAIAEIIVMADNLNYLSDFGYQVANLLKEKAIVLYM